MVIVCWKKTDPMCWRSESCVLTIRILLGRTNLVWQNESYRGKKRILSIGKTKNAEMQTRRRAQKRRRLRKRRRRQKIAGVWKRRRAEEKRVKVKEKKTRERHTEQHRDNEERARDRYRTHQERNTKKRERKERREQEQEKDGNEDIKYLEFFLTVWKSNLRNLFSNNCFKGQTSNVFPGNIIWYKLLVEKTSFICEI